jgi:23S rRNA (adenine2503-C2)-methyltransferase
MITEPPTYQLDSTGDTGHHSCAIDPRVLAPRDFYSQVTALGISDDIARRWAGSVIGRGERVAETVMRESHLAKRFSQYIADLPSLILKQHLTSPRDGFEKLLFQTADGMSIETVIIPLHKERSVSLCLSSQVGCVMGCSFCATARMTTRRNLSSWEILDQVAQARRIVLSQGRRVTGAVFMGMGEPFLNFDNVIRAADWLRQPLENAISGKAITVSTVGLVQEIERFTDLGLPFRLSISLGAATDEKRARLVPVAARTPIARVIAAARRHALTHKDRVNLAYVCIGGENVFEEDAKALADVIGDTPIRLDLIDVMDSSGRYQPPSPEELTIFRDALGLYLKHPVARRYSGGADIKASCGALAGA